MRWLQRADPTSCGRLVLVALWGESYALDVASVAEVVDLRVLQVVQIPHFDAVTQAISEFRSVSQSESVRRIFVFHQSLKKHCISLSSSLANIIA